MLGVEITLFGAAAMLLVCALLPRLRIYRSLFVGACVLLLSTGLFMIRGHLPPPTTAAGRVPEEVFGVGWWILGAWLVRSVLTLVMRRVWFPNDDLPHARRLFADLASALIYVIAFIGIVDTVLKEPISAVLATSGVLAIVLGLALQNTLGDVFSGLSINIEKPFGAGDWITLMVTPEVEGQIIEINWRATHIKTGTNDIIVIPNSVIAKAIVTNHRRYRDPYLSVVRFTVDSLHAPADVIRALQTAAAAAAGVATNSTVAYATGLGDACVRYELWFGVSDFAKTQAVQSAVVTGVYAACRHGGFRIGAAIVDVRVVAVAGPAPAPGAMCDTAQTNTP
jgi:small-conductance mechanosensitive channel